MLGDGTNLYGHLLEITGTDIIELFGESGTCKTTFCMEVIKDALTDKKKVLFIDTEKNIVSQPDGINLQYFPSFNDVYKYISALPKGYDLVILDSLGLPILGEFARLGTKERGDILLKAEAIAYYLKKYSYDNKALVLVTNQPTSAFNKGKDAILTPFGDKSIYFFKEVWKTQALSSAPERTACSVSAFRSRRNGRGKRLFTVVVNNDGVEVTK